MKLVTKELVTKFQNNCSCDGLDLSVCNLGLKFTVVALALWRRLTPSLRASYLEN